MAGASMNDIKARMKSVKSTMQITKAMELVATSKLRRAREKLDKARPYYEMLTSTISALSSLGGEESPFISEAKDGKTLYIVIAGDRGLAGGYNSNVFKLCERLCQKDEGIILPVGKKACEYYTRRGREIFARAELTQQVGVGEAMELSEKICRGFLGGEFTKAVVIYTRFASMISQVPVYEDILPISLPNGENQAKEIMIEEPRDELIERIVPQYVGGILYSAVTEALASESGMRRTSMNSANKNASEMIDSLMLKYNRARQAVITQEITEIVSGAEAL